MVAKWMTALVMVVVAATVCEAGIHGAGNFMRRMYPNGPEELYNTVRTSFQPPPRVGLPPYPVTDDLSLTTRFQQPAVINSEDRWMLSNDYYRPAVRPYFF